MKEFTFSDLNWRRIDVPELRAAGIGVASAGSAHAKVGGEHVTGPHPVPRLEN